MADAPFLPELPAGWEDTRATLHAYTLGVGAVPRAYADAHPKWWHVSLTVADDGLVTDAVPLSDGDSLQLRMDLTAHEVVMSTLGGHSHRFTMTGGLTGTAFADQLLSTAAHHGLDGQYHREKFENDEPRAYDRATAETFFRVLADVDAVFSAHRAELEGEVGPVQLWPHGFDLAFEWFGTRIESSLENGEVAEHPSQLNLGFYPGGRPYFYSNPWPFEGDQLLDRALPHGAEWHTEGWQGTILYYDQLAGDPDAERKLREYASAVYEITAPTLTA